jgi:hypothetical protein
MINSINSYCKEVLPELFESLTKLSFVWTIELLYAGDKTQAVGSVLYLSNLMNSKKSLEHFNEYILETFNGLFSLLTKLSCKFSLTIQSKVLELAKAMIINFKKSLSPEEKMPAFKRVTDFLVRLLPQNKMQEQRILITILHTLFSDSLSQASMAELMCGEQRRPEERIKIGDILNHEYAASDSMAADRYPDNCPPLYILLDYIVNTLKSYRTMLQYKAGNSGSGRFLTYDDCSVLTSVVLVMNHLFTKWKVNLDLFERTENTFHFDAYIKEILETLLEIIHENEYFNEKKMEFKGSSIRKEERPAVPNPIRGDPMDNNELASQRAAQVNYKPNPNVYYQNFEYHIYIDDYDFSVQGWSILVENIILFLSTFLVKPEVTTIVKACRTQAQAQAQQAVVHETETEYPVLNLRYQIIAKMFDLFSRLEYRIREAVDKGFKLLLKVETHEREIIPKEQLEQCFKPLLAFMQNQDPQERRNSLNENSMQCFMKLFLLFKGCFNAQRLFEKFTEYLNSFDQILGRDQQTQPREEDISQMNAIFRMISIIIKNTDFHRMLPRGFEIEKKLQEKNVYFYSLKPKLEKLLNGQSSVVISAFTKDKLKVDSYFTFLIDTLKLPESHPLRERICREDPADFIRDLKKDLEEKKQTEAEYEDKLFRWSKIVYVLAKKLPWFLSRNYSLIQFYHEYFKNLIVNVAEASTDEKYSLPTPDQQYKLDMFILTSKILVELVSNCEDPIPEEKINIIFELVDLIDLKICYYSNFVRNLFRDIIPTKFSENQKKQIFMHYFNFYHYVEGTKLSKIKEDRFYLKHVNTELILPMLSHIFKHESTKKSSFILSSEMISKLKAYFSMLTKPGAHQIGLEQMPMHLMVELTILVDFILCKIDFRNLDEPSMKERNKDIEDMLKSLLHLYWKCIAKKQDKSKLLVNLSKLVVSRLISHSKIIGKNAPQIKELYESILIASEDIIDEETKQIWLNVCNVILPQIKDYKNTTTGEQQPYHWFDEFLKLMEETEPTSPQGRDLIDGSNSNRWWIVIFRNRHLMHEFRNQIFDSNRYFSLYTHLRAWISMLKPNYFLYDTLLLYIAWYMKDYRQCMLEGKPPSDIFKLSGVKEEFLLGVLREVIKKDEDYSTGFLNRSYFLFRVFSMFIGRGKLDFDSYIKILSAYKRRGAAGSREDPSGSNIQIKRRLKSNFVIMNICLVILYHPKIKILESDIAKDGEKIAGKDKELMGIIYEYVIKEMPQKLSKEYMKYPYLVTLAYHIIKRILVLSDSETRDSYLDKILAKSNESIRAILSTNRDGNRAEAQDTLSLWIAVLLYKFIYEYKPELLEGLLQDFIELAKLFCENLKNKKASKEVQTLDDQVHFDPDEDIIEKFFVCFNVDSQEPRNISKGYYKGYSVLVMRILMKFVDKDCLPYFDQFSSDTINFPTQKKHLKFEIPHVLLDVCSDLLGNPTPSEYDIKLEIIMLLRCLIIPQSVKSPVYKKLAVDKDFLTAEHKIGILNCLNIEQFLKKNEGRKAFNKIFVETLWDLVIDFIE